MADMLLLTLRKLQEQIHFFEKKLNYARVTHKSGSWSKSKATELRRLGFTLLSYIEQGTVMIKDMPDSNDLMNELNTFDDFNGQSLLKIIAPVIERLDKIPRHRKMNTIVPMYRTTTRLCPAGIFTNATLVVSMMPYRPDDLETVRDVTRPYLATHGKPVAWGWDAVQQLGIKDIHAPDFGQSSVFEDGEVPVFWASDLTAQVVVESADRQNEGLVFTNEPGHMLVTDWKVEDLEKLGRGSFDSADPTA